MFPKVPTSAQLGWSHFRVLLGVSSQRARSFYVRQAEAHVWSVRQLELHVQQGLFEESLEPGLALPPLPRGRLYAYLILETATGLRLDLRFRLRARAGLVELGDAGAGQVVATVPNRTAG